MKGPLIIDVLTFFYGRVAIALIQNPQDQSLVIVVYLTWRRGPFYGGEGILLLSQWVRKTALKCTFSIENCKYIQKLSTRTT